jgi:proteasome accessory factor B
MARIRKLERLINLAAFMIGSPRAVTFEEIRSEVAGYGDETTETELRCFERDKSDLRELGLEIQVLPSDSTKKVTDAYKVDMKTQVLPDLNFEPAEWLLVRMSADYCLQDPGFPFRNDLLMALNKIAAVGDETALETSSSHIPDDGPGTGFLEEIQGAITNGKRIRLVISGSAPEGPVTENVDPYGFLCQRGRWLLIGRSHERDKPAYFEIDKIIQISVNEKSPGSRDFEMPADFDIRSYSGDKDYQLLSEDGLGGETARLRLHPKVAWWMKWQLDRQAVPVTAAADAEDSSDGWETVEIRVTDREKLYSWLFEMGESVVLLFPGEMREEFVSRLDQAIEYYAEDDGAE